MDDGSPKTQILSGKAACVANALRGRRGDHSTHKPAWALWGERTGTASDGFCTACPPCAGSALGARCVPTSLSIAVLHRKAAEHCRTPKRGRVCRSALRACAFEVRLYPAALGSGASGSSLSDRLAAHHGFWRRSRVARWRVVGHCPTKGGFGDKFRQKFKKVLTRFQRIR
jgi:hypothetical protein